MELYVTVGSCLHTFSVLGDNYSFNVLNGDVLNGSVVLFLN